MKIYIEITDEEKMIKLIEADLIQIKQAPKTPSEVKELLLNQMALIKQESEKNPDKLSELTMALCKTVEAYRTVMNYK